MSKSSKMIDVMKKYIYSVGFDYKRQKRKNCSWATKKKRLRMGRGWKP